MYDKKRNLDYLKEIEKKRKIVFEKLKEVNKTLRELEPGMEGLDEENKDGGGSRSSKLPPIPRSQGKSSRDASLIRGDPGNSPESKAELPEEKAGSVKVKHKADPKSPGKDFESRDKTLEERKKLIVDRVNESMERLRRREEERKEEKERFKEEYSLWLKKDRQLREQAKEKEKRALSAKEDPAKKVILLKRKEMNKPVKDLGLAEHENAYEQTREKLLNERLESRRAANAKKQQLSPSYQSRFHEKTVEESQKPKALLLEEQNERRRKKIRIKVFEKVVHESFAPKKDLLKELELRRQIAMQEIRRLPRRRARKEVKENSEDLIADYELVLPKEDPKKDGNNFLKTSFHKGAKSVSPNTSKISSERSKFETSWVEKKDYLKELREKRGPSTGSHSLDVIKKVVSQKDIFPSEKYTIINARLETLEEKIAQKEKLNKANKNGKFYNARERTKFSLLEELEGLNNLDDLYVESINAKLFLLKKL